MNLQTLINQVNSDGWVINEEIIEKHVDQDSSFKNAQDFIRRLLNFDLKEISSSKLLSENIKGKSKINQLTTPMVLQISSIRNVSAPKANEESGAAPRLLKITLTDGNSYIDALEMQSIPNISLKCPPGTKIKLINKVPLTSGFLILTPNNTQVLGGHVEELYSKWKLSQSVSKYFRNTLSNDGLGPPKWVPFGQKISEKKENNFKALKNDSTKEKEEDEFESQRKQVVKEITQSSSQKVFGGGKQMLDSNVQKVLNAGFTIQEAEWALRKNKNDANRAIQELRNNSINSSGRSHDNVSFEVFEESNRSGGRRGRGRKRDRRGGGGPDGSDDDTVHPSSRPSGPASLLDYLEPNIQHIIKDDQTENNSYRGGGNYTTGQAYNQRREAYTQPKHNYHDPNHPAFSDSYPVVGENQSFSRGRNHFNKNYVEKSYQKELIAKFDASMNLNDQPRAYGRNDHHGYHSSGNRSNQDSYYSANRYSSDEFYGSMEFQRGGRGSGFRGRSNYRRGGRRY